jgi:hypothetical protein
MSILFLRDAVAAAATRAISTPQAANGNPGRVIGGIRSGGSSLTIGPWCRKGTCTSTASGRKKRLTNSIGWIHKGTTTSATREFPVLALATNYDIERLPSRQLKVSADLGSLARGTALAI